MKTKLLLTSLLSASVVLSGCSLIRGELVRQSKSAAENKAKTADKAKIADKTTSENNSTTTKNQNSTDKVYGLNEEWIVDSQWKLKITEVKTTPDRNKYSKAQVAQVVLIKYTYENLGYKDEYQDLFLMPRTVVDGAKKVSEIYPVRSSKYPEPTPVGAISESTVGYGLSMESDKIKIYFEQFDHNAKKMQKATFEVPVTK